MQLSNKVFLRYRHVRSVIYTTSFSAPANYRSPISSLLERQTVPGKRAPMTVGQVLSVKSLTGPSTLRSILMSFGLSRVTVTDERKIVRLDFQTRWCVLWGSQTKTIACR